MTTMSETKTCAGTGQRTAAFNVYGAIGLFGQCPECHQQVRVHGTPGDYVTCTHDDPNAARLQYVPTDPQVRADLADLHVLEFFDCRRTLAGHDYNKQRRTEINRRNDALLDQLHAETPSGQHTTLDGRLPASTPDELRDAYNRVLAPRLRRLMKSPGAIYGTAATVRTIKAFEQTEQWVLGLTAPTTGW